MSKAVFKMKIDVGRMGILEGVFIAEKSHVNRLVNDKIEVYFGEVLGKHSEICGAIEPDEISFVSDAENVIRIMEEHQLCSGFDPFDYTGINLSDTLGEDYKDEYDDMTLGEIFNELMP